MGWTVRLLLNMFSWNGWTIAQIIWWCRYYIKRPKFFCIFDYFKRLLQNCTTAYFPLVIQSVSFCFIFSSMPFRKPVTTSAFYKKHNNIKHHNLATNLTKFSTIIFWKNRTYQCSQRNQRCRMKSSESMTKRSGCVPRKIRN